MVYNSYIIKSFFKFGYTLGFKIIDQGFIQYFGPKGLINLFLNLSNRVSYMHSGYIYHLFLIIFIGLFFLLIGLINPIFYEESYLTFYVIK
jgi:NADH-ubiquinone oxidoreductase chain 5